MSASAVEVRQPVTQSRAASRIGALDWTKGALVFLMVVYHSINYSVFRPMAFEYLAFLPESFIFIAGFLVGQVYATKYNNSSWEPYLRLLVRGLKVLILFLVLNIGFCVAREHDFEEGLWNFANRATAIFLSGNGRQGIFEVMLPIAYFLLLAPSLLWIRLRCSAATAFGAAAIFILCMALERVGVSSKNLSLLSAGFVGMASGLISLDAINRFARRWLMVIGFYILYRLCSYLAGEIYSVQMFGALASLTLIYACALRLDCGSWTGRQMVMFGKYSLLGYLAQIPLIQLLVHLSGGKPTQWYGVAVVIVATTVLLSFVLRAVQELRNRHASADRAYKFIFA